MSYYNTTNLIGEDLLAEINNAKSQEDKIALFFSNRAMQFYSPSDILELIFNNTVPLTSVRRALSDLTDQGILRKTDKLKPGLYGKPVHCWKYNLKQFYK